MKWKQQTMESDLFAEEVYWGERVEKTNVLPKREDNFFNW